MLLLMPFAPELLPVFSYSLIAPAILPSTDSNNNTSHSIFPLFCIRQGKLRASRFHLSAGEVCSICATPVLIPLFSLLPFYGTVEMVIILYFYPLEVRIWVT